MVSLSISGVLMVGKVPIFMTNLYHGGPYLGVLGAKVDLEYSYFCQSFEDHLDSDLNLIYKPSHKLIKIRFWKPF